MTFNYDLVIEESFESAKLWNPVTGYGVTTGGKRGDWSRRWLKSHKANKRGGQSKIQLLKLHGSVNWTLYNNKTIRLKPRPYVVRTKNRNPSFEKISILAPGWNKPIHKNPYKRFWREARLRLEQCKSLVILGYSLPETDLLAKALLAEVVRLRSARGNCLRELHLCDPSDIVKQRFIDLFTPALESRGQVFRYANIQEFADRIKA
ncbi:MAG TPA: SIR2 family protein [Candidatus Angelobacter sp.]|nr:SIR2 family protein [Candidatus Angelobacter sp.]